MAKRKVEKPNIVMCDGCPNEMPESEIEQCDDCGGRFGDCCLYAHDCVDVAEDEYDEYSDDDDDYD